jgi:hypothetical protein
MEPVSSGVGGDLFAIVWDAKTHRLYGLNASGRAPLGLSYEQMKAELAKLARPTIPPHGILPISRARRGRRLVPSCTRSSASCRWRRCSRRRSATPRRVSRSPSTSPTTGTATSRLRGRQAARRVPRRPTRPAASPGRGRDFQEPRAGPHLRADRRAGPRRFLPRRNRGPDRRLHARERRLVAEGRLRKTHVDLGRARSRSTTAATTSTSCRPTARASRRCRC